MFPRLRVLVAALICIAFVPSSSSAWTGMHRTHERWNWTWFDFGNQADGTRVYGALSIQTSQTESGTDAVPTPTRICAWADGDPQLVTYSGSTSYRYTKTEGGCADIDAEAGPDASVVTTLPVTERTWDCGDQQCPYPTATEPGTLDVTLTWALAATQAHPNICIGDCNTDPPPPPPPPTCQYATGGLAGFSIGEYDFDYDTEDGKTDYATNVTGSIDSALFGELLRSPGSCYSEQDHYRARIDP